MSGKYDDMIYMKRPKSKHKPMSIKDRAAQFASFAALTGHKETLDETARETSKKIEISEDMKDIIDSKLNIILENLSQNPEVTLTYFVKDKLKEGGRYQTSTKKIKKYDRYYKRIIFEDNSQINISDIIKINSKIISDEDIL